LFLSIIDPPLSAYNTVNIKNNLIYVQYMQLAFDIGVLEQLYHIFGLKFLDYSTLRIDNPSVFDMNFVQL